MKKWEYGLVVLCLVVLFELLSQDSASDMLVFLGMLVGVILFILGCYILTPPEPTRRSRGVYWYYHLARLELTSKGSLWRELTASKRTEWRHELDRELVQRFGKR